MSELITVENVWKRYLLGETPNLASLVSNVLFSRKRTPVWALQDVSVRIGRGETVGIIGLNGSGKTTLLRTLAKVTVPTSGKITTHGRVAALIALGAGFHNELTGHDNIFLNGSILGMRKKEIQRKYDSIVEFAELGKFIDTPVKRYSSGMRVRLGFAIAAHVEPDILLVDEVLAVGDWSFRKKSISRMLEFRDEGTTVLFVSHNMPSVEMMCDRCIWLHEGKVQADGDTATVVREYMNFTSELMSNANQEQARELGMGSGEILVENVTVHDESDRERNEFGFGQDIRVKVHYNATVPLDNPLFVIVIRSVDFHLPLIVADMRNDGTEPGHIAVGKGTVECTFRNLPLRPGPYDIMVSIKLDYVNTAFRPMSYAGFVVKATAAELGFHSKVAESNLRGSAAPVMVPYSWALDNGQKVILGGVNPRKLDSGIQNVAD